MNAESRLQSQMVIQFSQRYPEQRGRLIGYFATSESVIQTSQKLSLGLVKGASDLFYITELGEMVGIEVKAPLSQHNRLHLVSQAEWLLKVPKWGYFCDNIETFRNIIEGGSGIDPEVVLENCLQKKTGAVKWDEVKKKRE
jgi:hypothetical protein